MPRVARWLGSLAVAIPLLGAIGGVLAWGTFYEARYGTAGVQRFVYQSWWFQALLGFLAVNLALAALERWPWQRRHTPFLLAHLGIILILSGGVLGGRLGIEGQLIIPEGETSSTLELPAKQILIYQPNPGAQYTIPATFDSQAWRRTPNLTIPLTVEGRTVPLTVDRYEPDASVTEQVVGGGAEAWPAVQVVLEHQGQSGDGWLFARDPERFGVRWGDVHAFFLEVPDAAHLARLAGRAALKHFPPNAVVLVATPDGRLAAILTGPAGQSKRLAAIVVGQTYPHPWSDTTFRVAAYEPRAQLRHEVTPRSDRVRAEAVHLVAQDGARRPDVWVPFGERAELPVGRERLVVDYRKAQRELPFAVKLLDFRRRDYPGTQMAQAFEADVELTDPARGVTLRKTIRMNMPLKYRGFSLFQASFIEGPVETTVLAVRNDPGTPFVYAGFLIVIAGVVTMFVMPRPAHA